MHQGNGTTKVQKKDITRGAFGNQVYRFKRLLLSFRSDVRFDVRFDVEIDNLIGECSISQR